MTKPDVKTESQSHPQPNQFEIDLAKPEKAVP